MINHAIGAKGVVSQECKAVVEQYGVTIMDLLLAEVLTNLRSHLQFFLVFFLHSYFLFDFLNFSWLNATGTTKEDMLSNWVM